MSFTYAHYSASNASLPTDYGLISRYAAAHSSHVAHTHEDDDLTDVSEDGEVVDSEYSTTGHRRQGSQRVIPTMASIQTPGIVSEVTPLLGANPPIPIIIEEGDVAQEGKSEPGALAAYWEESKILMKYALPVYGTQLLEHSLSVASVISIGHLSTKALAASTLGSMTASVTAYSILTGFASALDTVLPSAWTSDQPQLVGLWSQRMTVVLTVLLFPIAFIWLNAESLLLLLGQDPEVAHLAALYLRWVLLGLPAHVFNQVSRRYFQSQGLFHVSTHVILVVAPVNVVLNYLLVWGPKPIRLGFIGAPIATALSFNLIALLSLLYGIYGVPHTAWYPISRRMVTSLGVLVQLGIAGAGQTASEWWSWELVALAASQFGPVALATQSILLVTSSTTCQAPFSVSVAASVRIGNLLGQKNAYRARIAAYASFLVVLAVQTVQATMFIVFRNSWGGLFNDDEEVMKLVASILPLLVPYQIVDGTNICSAGVLRARGKQATGALLNLSSYYIIGIPFGLWLAFSRGVGLLGLWIGLTVSLAYGSVIGSWLCIRTNWNREVQKVEMRMEKERVESERVHADDGAARA